MIRRAISVFSGIAIALAFAGVAVAQTQSADIAVTLSPNHPQAFQAVVISLESYSINLGTANIEWRENGKTTASGIGKTEYNFTTKGIGIASTIEARITPLGSFVPIVKSIVISPIGVDLLWEAIDSIVPPLYRGKAMPSSEATIKFVAVPEVRTTTNNLVPANQLMYAWSKNYENNVSGHGRDSYTITTSNLKPTENIGVTAQSRDGNVAADARINITTGNPKILWYASSPLYGPIFDRALTNTNATVTGSETSIFAEPYFFSPRDINSPMLSFEWKINGQAVETPTFPNTMFLHRENDEPGEATLSLLVRSTTRLFQEASSSLTLTLIN